MGNEPVGRMVLRAVSHSTTFWTRRGYSTTFCPAKQHVWYVGSKAGPEFGLPDVDQVAEGESKKFSRSDGRRGAFGGREEGIQRDSSEGVKVECDDIIRLFL